MKVPRNLCEGDVNRLLGRHYDYWLDRSSGSYMTGTLATITGEHSETVSHQHCLHVGTLGQFVSDVSAFVGLHTEDVPRPLWLEGDGYMPESVKDCDEIGCLRCSYKPQPNRMLEDTRNILVLEWETKCLLDEIVGGVAL